MSPKIDYTPVGLPTEVLMNALEQLGNLTTVPAMLTAYSYQYGAYVLYFGGVMSVCVETPLALPLGTPVSLFDEATGQDVTGTVYHYLGSPGMVPLYNVMLGSGKIVHANHVEVIPLSAETGRI
jgi:hypothetical protein